MINIFILQWHWIKKKNRLMEFYQIGLNKNKIQIFKIINVTLNNYENLKNSLSKYTGRNIKELDILFFWQRKRDDNNF